MNGRFWLGFGIGLLVGILGTILAIFAWFVPVRSTTTSSGAIVPVVQVGSIAGVSLLDVTRAR